MKIDPIATVQIKDVRLNIIIGTKPEERLAPQELSMNITFTYDAALAANSDKLAQTVDYAELLAKVVEKTAKTQFFLLERLGSFILESILENQQISKVSIILEKTAVLPHTKAVSVMMSGSKESQESFYPKRHF